MEEKLIELHVVLCSVCLEFTAKLFWHLEIEGLELRVFFLVSTCSDWVAS